MLTLIALWLLASLREVCAAWRRGERVAQMTHVVFDLLTALAALSGTASLLALKNTSRS